MLRLLPERTRDRAVVSIGGRYHLHARLFDPHSQVRVIGVAAKAPSWITGEPLPLLVVEDEAGTTMKCEPWQLSVMHPCELARFLRHHAPTFPPPLRVIERS